MGNQESTRDKIKIIVDLMINTEPANGPKYYAFPLNRLKELIPESKGDYYYLVKFISKNIESFSLFGIVICNNRIFYNDAVVI